MGRKSDAQPPLGLRAIDLFAGCGGLTLGLKRAGFRVLGAVEIDEVAAETYRLNHPDVVLLESDIRSVSPDNFRKTLGLAKGQLDLLAGCPPCQGFSTLRTRNGGQRNRDPRNQLISEMLRFVDAFEPKSVMMENVPRLREHSLFQSLCRNLRRRGYKLSFDVKDAAAYGVPQRRRRLILIGKKSSAVALAEESTQKTTVRMTIGGLPRPGQGNDDLHNLPEKTRSERVQNLIRDIPRDGGSRRDLPKERQLPCHTKSDGFSDVYGRMAWDDVAPTITSGCFNPSKGRFLHPDQDRAITMREAALLQTFPADYHFPIARGKQAIALMVGNALPPEFIRIHASQIAQALAGTSVAPK
jgi:DNA (cytosine-5)-methyltransferase 1